MSGATPEASAVIAYYNGAATIREQLEALATQQDPPIFEVLIVDNNSTDNPSDVCSEFEGRLNLRIVPAHDAAGGSYARNVGVIEARGRNILVCDQDDIVSPTWVATLHRELDRADVMATGPVEVATLNPTPVAEAYTGGAADARIRPFPVQGYLPIVFGCNFAVRRSTYIEVDGMDYSYNGGDEDTDFCWRVQESGRTLSVLDGALVSYRLRHRPIEIFQQRRGYGRGRVLTCVRSRGVRVLSGMSMRWTVRQVLALPFEWLTSLRSEKARLEFAGWAGALLGTLEGQWQYQIRRRVPAPLKMSASTGSVHPRQA